MPRTTRPVDAKRSELWLRKLINDHPNLLNDYLIQQKIIDDADKVEWLSPVQEDNFAEYYDEEFLDILKIDKKTLSVPLSKFWPTIGPRWDGLGNSQNKYFLIEAKAHIEETVDYSTNAVSQTSIDLIAASIDQAKNFYSNNKQTYWQKPFYQYANRLAHLYYMKELNNLDVYVIFIYFCNEPDVIKSTSKEECTGHIRTIDKVFSLNGKCKNKINFLVETDLLK